MTGQGGIGYAQYVDAEVRNPADQPPMAEETAEEEAYRPTTTDDDRADWRSWFGKGTAHVAAGDDQDTDELADDGLADDEYADDGLADDGLAGDETEAEEERWPRLRLPNVRLPRLRPPRLPSRSAPSPSAPSGTAPSGAAPSRRAQIRFPLTARPLISPHLRTDPRLKIWIIRAAVGLILFIVVTILLDWRFGVTAAVLYACADTIYRSRTTGITPTSVRVTSAQRRTGRRLSVVRTAGYMALHARTIPGTDSVIDHLVVGPSGIFAVDSQLMDTRLPVRAIDGMLYHGPVSQAKKIEHARFEASHAAALIAAELGHRVRVRPAMVLYGPNIPWVIMRVKGVDVIDGRHVGTYFRKQSKATAGHHLDSAQIALVYAAAAHALPPLY